MPLIRSTLVTIPVWDCWAKAAELMRESAVAPAKITFAIFKAASQPPRAIEDNRPCTEWFRQGNFSRHLRGRDGWPKHGPAFKLGLGGRAGAVQVTLRWITHHFRGWRPVH